MHTFDEIYDNDNIINSLKSTVINENISHAYIFFDLNNSDNSMVCNIFAKAILCTSKQSINTPCNECKSCNSYERANHPDLVYISSKKSTIGVDIIREDINKTINIIPYGSYKVIIINKAHTLTKEAQNALLKTLEEPPKYAVIILICDNMQKFINTLVSRCVVIRIKPKSSIIQKNQEQLVNEIHSFLINLNRLSLNEVFESYNFLESNKENINEILNIMQSFLRDSIVLKKTNNSNFLTEKNNIHNISTYTNEATIQSLINKSNAISFCINALRQNANFQMSVEVMLIQLRQG